MKRFYLPAVLGLLSLFIISFYNTDLQNPFPYKWEEVVKPGNGSFQDTWIEGKWPMAITPVSAFQNKLWMIGKKKSWSSGNGINWIAYLKTDWGERYGMAYVYFKNKIWMLGGMKTWDDFRNDVWVTSDGKKWEQVVTNAEWSQRRDPHVFVFKNKIWLIGGDLSSGKRNELPSRALNDVWSTDDGIHWNLIAATAPWEGKGVSKILVFKNKIWMIGGINYNETWCSDDGKTWKHILSKILWKKKQGHGIQVFDDKLWVFGGINVNDVWFSADGINWQMMGKAPWSPRSATYSTVFKNKLWLYSGKTGREDSWAGDIWTLNNNIKSH